MLLAGKDRMYLHLASFLRELCSRPDGDLVGWNK